MRQKLQMINNKEVKTLNEGFSEFINYSQIKNLSPYTIKFYKNVFNIFTKFYSSEFYIEDIDLSTIQNYIMFLKNEMNENEVTINTNIRGIRSILYYFMKLGYLKEFKIEKIKQTQEIIETYSYEDISCLLTKPNIKKCSYTEYRNFVVCNFLLGTGCRLSTLINIKIEDLDFNNDLVKYSYTKNRKQQLIPISNNLKSVLLEYLQYRKGKSEEYLFVNAYGNKLDATLLSHNLADYNKSRGIVRTGVHRWRHTFSKLYILNNGNIFKLQKILGHSSLEIVKSYVNMFTSDIQKDWNEFNPLESVKLNNNHIKMKK